jgi:peroxiredoxin Q/BCP
MLDVGDIAPEFTLPDAEGNSVTLSALLSEGPLILYFYPADFTMVCTAEACEIRDRHEDIRAVDAQVVGISPQGERSHSRFRDRYDLPFPLLCDSRKKVIRAFGVDGPMGFGVRRATFLIAPDRSIQKRVLADFTVGQHIQFIDQVVEDLGDY